ncbi:Protein of unknown function DUF1800 [Candidatus Nanopelagicaceae bacterium]
MDLKRLETARLYNRFGLGPRPGEYAQALKAGVAATKQNLLNPPQIDSGAVALPVVTDLGKRPEPNTPEVIAFARGLRVQSEAIEIWWLDQMVATNKPLQEKMVWFWHGHWATSIGKVNYPMPMLLQNQTFRKYALGNFNDFAKAMFMDGALQIWLDGGDNTVKAPNENFSREMMELFLLGVNRYSETDVKELARAFTGYQVSRSTGAIAYNDKRRDTKSVTILGKSAVMTPEDAITHLVSQPNCAQFIAERIWFRFVSSQTPLPAGHPMIASFTGREIAPLVSTLINGSDLANPQYEMVKSPVEWFIGVCRALGLTPSKLDSFTKLHGYLDKLSQIPFSPPNVGGWPTDEAWLSSASAQFRITFATWLVGQADLSALTEQVPAARAAYLADLLAVPEWSPRTSFALREVRDVIPRLLILAICSPEYVVSA